MAGESGPDGHGAAAGEVAVGRARALRAFEVLAGEATEGQLWFLHAALEKQPETLVRGGWGRLQEGRLPRRGAASCPLTALALGRPPQTQAHLEAAARISEELLKGHGLSAADFYTAWDAGWLGRRELLRLVDACITARVLGA
jgi:hypothetical protein